MFKNYFKTAIRNLMRYKGFTLINILGLTLGITGCLLIALFVSDEKKFDKSVSGYQDIYRIYEERNEDGNITRNAPVPPMYATFLKAEYPEVEKSARILMSGDKFLVELGENKNYEEKGLFVDSTLLELFELKLLSGDPATALDAPQTVVLSADMAKRYFNNQEAVGKTIYIDKDTFEVKGVLDKLPDHFHLNINFLMSMPSAGIDPERFQKWTWHQLYSYVKLKPGTDAGQLQDKFQAHIKKEIIPTLTISRSTFLPFLQPLKDIHLKSADFIYDNAIRGNQSYVKGLSIIALFVLIIACFNFINLSTARSVRRAKEIGIRKVVGAERKQLVIQFIGETILLSTLSMILASIITMIVLPSLNAFTSKSISFNPFTQPLIALIILGAGILIGILAGIYPALILSGFKPITVLKTAKPRPTGNLGWLRQGLVVIQFSLSALLIVSSIIVYRQISFMNNKDLGFDKEQLVFFNVRGDIETNIETFKSELRRSANITAVTSGYGLPGDRYATKHNIVYWGS
jgi:putative ABC transport system permease protein